MRGTIDIGRNATRLDAPGRPELLFSWGATGDPGEALAAAARTTGNLYMARIPEHAIKLLERAGLVTIRSTMMNGVRGIEYRFRPEATEYLARYFEEIGQ